MRAGKVLRLFADHSRAGRGPHSGAIRFQRCATMNRLATPAEFMARTWIFVVQALIFGGLASFSLVFGPLFLFGFMKKANGMPGTDAGIALTALSVPFLLVFALAVYHLSARRRPLL